MDFIDSHAHLADPAFDQDRDEVIARAREAGAVSVVCIGESLASAARARAVALREPGFCFWTAGVHPHDAAGFVAGRDIDAIRAQAESGAVAIGECGLDYHYETAPRAVQRAAFAAQLALAQERRVPVVVHTRDAEDDTAAMVREAGASQVAGVLHCFTGSRTLADVALEAGWHVSFSGIVTFRSWTDLDVVRAIPSDRLLVESDAPYLAPVPHRGRRNEPAMVVRTLERVAQIRSEPVETTAAATTANARRFFALAS